MTNFRGLGPADRHRLGELVRLSNAQMHRAIVDFVDGGHRRIGAALRTAAPPTPEVRRFLDELRSMRDYVGTSYRVSQITRDGLAALRRGDGRPFADPGAQCAFVLPSSAAQWAKRGATAQLRAGAYRLFTIFDESVPQKNLSTARLADHVIVPPATPLRLKALRIVIARGAGNHTEARIVAQFACADQPCRVPYDLYDGTPMT